MKRPITKANIRTEIDQQIADYLKQGGRVSEVERGISGHDNANGPLKPEPSLFQQPKVSRTYVPELIAAVDARRRPAATQAKPAKKGRTRKKMIYDDFGEPLRWEWVEE